MFRSDTTISIYVDFDDFRDEVLEYVFGNCKDDVIAYVNESLAPEDVFDKNELEEWALNNDFTKGE